MIKKIKTNFEVKLFISFLTTYVPIRAFAYIVLESKPWAPILDICVVLAVILISRIFKKRGWRI